MLSLAKNIGKISPTRILPNFIIFVVQIELKIKIWVKLKINSKLKTKN